MTQHARAKQEQATPPILDPTLQSKLVAKFGPKLMKQGFTALPVLVQKYYRYVPGNTIKQEGVNAETGEVSTVEKISYMTPSEYVVMTAIWSFWWTNQGDPWPGVEKICGQLGKSERQVRRYLQRLRDKGFMLSVEQFNDEGKQISNRYDFTPFLKRLVAYLDAMEPPKKPRQSIIRGDIFDRERMTDKAGRGCHFRQANEDKSDQDSLDEENSNSSGSAATQKGTVLSAAPRTIRNTEKEEKETETPEEIESHQTSNSLPTEKELPSAARAKDVDEEKEGKKLTPFERTAMIAGIPLEVARDMQTWLAACPRPKETPLFIEGILTVFSQQMRNVAYLKSNFTQATKIFRYAQSKGYGQDDFRVMLYDAEKRCRWEGVQNPMAYFFTTLKVELLLAITSSRPPLPPDDDEDAGAEGIPQAESELHEDQDALNDGAGEEQPRTTLAIRVSNPMLGWNYMHAKWLGEGLQRDLGEHLYDYAVLCTDYEGEDGQHVYERYGLVLFERGTEMTEGWVLLTREEIEAKKEEILQELYGDAG